MALIKEGAVFTTIMGELVFPAVFFSHARSYKEFKAASLLGLSFSILQIAFFMAVYISTYEFPTLITLNYPYQQLTRLVHLGRFVTNLESIFLLFWAIASSIRFSIYFYIAALISSYIVKIKSPKRVLPFITILTFFIAMLPENFSKYILVIRKLGIDLFWIYLLALPLLLWIIARWKGDFKKCKG